MDNVILINTKQTKNVKINKTYGVDTKTIEIYVLADKESNLECHTNLKFRRIILSNDVQNIFEMSEEEKETLNVILYIIYLEPNPHIKYTRKILITDNEQLNYTISINQ